MSKQEVNKASLLLSKHAYMTERIYSSMAKCEAELVTVRIGVANVFTLVTMGRMDATSEIELDKVDHPGRGS